MIADMTTRPETPTLRTQNYPVFVVLQTLLGVWQKRKYLLLLFDNISIGSSIFMDKYGLFNKAGPKHCFTRWSPPVDVVSVQVWGTLFVSDHEGGVPTRSVKRSKPPLWFPYPLRPENKQHRLHCKAWHRPTLNFAVSYSSSQAASFVLRFRVNK